MTEEELIHILKAKKMDTSKGWFCPTETNLAAYAEGRVSGLKKVRLENHLSGCSRCLQQIGFLVRMASEKPGLEEIPFGLLLRARELPTKTKKLALPAWRWATAGATLVFLMAFSLVFLRQAEPPMNPKPELPSPPGQSISEATASSAPSQPADDSATGVRSVGNGLTITSSPEIVFPVEGLKLVRQDLEFRWKPFPRALFYEIRLTTAEGSLVWEARAEQPQSRPPENVTLIPDQKYFVTVLAYLPDTRIMKAKPVGFVVSRKK